jgi:hypothetical protein
VGYSCGWKKLEGLYSIYSDDEGGKDRGAEGWRVKRQNFPVGWVWCRVKLSILLVTAQALKSAQNTNARAPIFTTKSSALLEEEKSKCVPIKKEIDWIITRTDASNIRAHVYHDVTVFTGLFTSGVNVGLSGVMQNIDPL